MCTAQSVSLVVVPSSLTTFVVLLKISIASSPYMIMFCEGGQAPYAAIWLCQIRRRAARYRCAIRGAVTLGINCINMLCNQLSIDAVCYY